MEFQKAFKSIFERFSKILSSHFLKSIFLSLSLRSDLVKYQTSALLEKKKKKG